MEYQNLFTQVQVVAPPHHGVHIDPRDERERFGEPVLIHLFGRLGNAQLGPIYLGGLGVAS
jgi:photosynthetic reaction center M subunit